MKNITLFFLLLISSHSFFAQDTCATATPINAAGLYVITTINGTDIPSPICTQNGAVPATRPPAGEWYSYTPSQNYSVTVTTNISQNTPRVDTRFHVYTGTCGNLTCFAGDDNSGSSFSSVATFNVTANTTYIIAFDNRWTSNGFTFQLIENPIVVPVPAPISYVAQTITTINNSYNICIVDMNGDHKDDIVGISSGNMKVHYQNTTGPFTVTNYPITGTHKLPSWSIAAGDYNKDGFNDILLGSGNGLTFLKSNSTGTAFTNDTPGQYVFCQRTNFVDLNNDGNLDAFSCHDIDPNVYYLNDGSGNFTYYQSGTTPGAYMLGITPSGGNYASLWTDIDNDGDLDLFISKCSGPPSELHRNDGNGVFTDISAFAGINVTPVQSWSSAINDFDNDGDMDIIIGSNGSVRSMFFRNNLGATNAIEEAFTNITVGSGWDTYTTTNRDYISYDFDNDGKVDVMGGGNKIMFNQGNNVFLPVTISNISVGAVGDLNNDGFIDFLNGNTIKYAVPNGNNWFKLTLKGIQSNSNGIGARVEILGAWGKQIRDARSGEGFEFMSSLNIHFGLGLATTIDQVNVKWPSGVVDTYYNVPINTTLNAVEGSTLAVPSISNSNFSVYPNPAKNVISIQQNASNAISLNRAEIYDINGRLVLEKNISNEQSINVEKLSTGSYILLLIDSNSNRYSQKIIKE